MKFFSDKENTEVVILSRYKFDSEELLSNVRTVLWDGKTVGEWISELEGAEAVINLAGRSIDCRHTEENKKQCIESRVTATKLLGSAIQQCIVPPKVWLNASAIGYYGNREDEIITENSSAGDGFVSEICKQWEKTFWQSETPHPRKIVFRIGVVLAEEGGALKPLTRLARFCLGGKAGSGNQYLSWIHEEDLVRMFEFAIAENIEGTFNATAPNPETNKSFMATLRNVIGAPFGIPAAAWIVKAVAPVIGTEADLILQGQKVLPEKALQSNFKFKYQNLADALKEILAKE